jgi:hypothetical protein
MARLLGQGTSREAEAIGRELARLPYSRSSFERIGHDVGSLFRRPQPRIVEVLIQEHAVPAEARSVSMSIDRVALPMLVSARNRGFRTGRVGAEREEARKAQPGPPAGGGSGRLLGAAGPLVGLGLAAAVALALDRDHVGVVDGAVNERRRARGVGEDGRPLAEGEVRRHDEALVLALRQV